MVERRRKKKPSSDSFCPFNVAHPNSEDFTWLGGHTSPGFCLKTILKRSHFDPGDITRTRGGEWNGPTASVLVMNFSVCTFPHVNRKRRAEALSSRSSVIKHWPAFSRILIMYQRMSSTSPVFFIKVLQAGI